MTAPGSYQSPEAVLEDLGASSPTDLEIEAIAQYCGATIVYEDLAGCAARIAGMRDRAIITVEASAPRSRQRFSAAHELGHWMCDRGKAAFACTEENLIRDWEGNAPERRANRYAADLLLPTKMFKSSARGHRPVFDDVRKLATEYDTSLTATAIRLVEHGPLPAMIVCNGADGRRWFFRSSIVPLWPLKVPGTGSIASRLLRGARARSGPTEVDADDWIEHEDAKNFCVIEDSVVAGASVLTLLWWKDEAQLLALDDD